MANEQSATEMLRRLSAQQIRERLNEIDAEARALKTLLRAAIRMEDGKPSARPEGGSR